MKLTTLLARVKSSLMVYSAAMLHGNFKDQAFHVSVSARNSETPRNVGETFLGGGETLTVSLTRKFENETFQPCISNLK